MKIKTHSVESDGTLLITLEIAPSVASTFLAQEQALGSLLNEVGLLSTQTLLERYDSDASSVCVSTTKYYLKSIQKKSMKPLMARLK